VRRRDQEKIEKRLNILLLKMAELQEMIWEGIELLEARGLLRPDLEKHVLWIMSDVSYWMDQCTIASESPPVLLRRMEVHLSRLDRTHELIESRLQQAFHSCQDDDIEHLHGR
jgi:hypothetical protein